MLIVPYGIETLSACTAPPVHTVLIVPYGIETGDPQRKRDPYTVLIVPYGIETRYTMKPQRNIPVC